jgi:hypothetical protein
MPRHHPRPVRPPDLERLALDLAELLDGIDLTTRYAEDEGNRKNARPRRWDVHGPGLIAQLEQAAGDRVGVPKTQPLGYDPALGYRTYVPALALLEGAPVPAHPPRLGSHSKPESRTPGSDEALSLLEHIETATTDLRYRMLRSVGRKQDWRDLPLRASLRAVDVLADDVPPELRSEACGSVRHWRDEALIVLGYHDRPAVLAKPCPFCGGVVRHDESGAWCENREWHAMEGVAGKWSESDWLAVREGRGA